MEGYCGNRRLSVVLCNCLKPEFFKTGAFCLSFTNVSLFYVAKHKKLIFLVDSAGSYLYNKNVISTNL